MQSAALSPNDHMSGLFAEAELRELSVHFLRLCSFKAYIYNIPKDYIIYLMYFNKFLFCLNKLSSFISNQSADRYGISYRHGWRNHVLKKTEFWDGLYGQVEFGGSKGPAHETQWLSI